MPSASDDLRAGRGQVSGRPDAHITTLPSAPEAGLDVFENLDKTEALREAVLSIGEDGAARVAHHPASPPPGSNTWHRWNWMIRGGPCSAARTLTLVFAHSVVSRRRRRACGGSAQPSSSDPDSSIGAAQPHRIRAAIRHGCWLVVRSSAPHPAPGKVEAGGLYGCWLVEAPPRTRRPGWREPVEANLRTTATCSGEGSPIYNLEPFNGPQLYSRYTASQFLLTIDVTNGYRYRCL